MSIYPITLGKSEKLPLEIAEQIFDDITKDEEGLEIKFHGSWQIPCACRGLVVGTDFKTGERIIYGKRSMFNIRQGSYQLEGWVSVGGEKYSCFTSSDLFELENGHLINVGTIFPRMENKDGES